MFLEADINVDGKLDRDELSNFFYKFTIKFGNDVGGREFGEEL